MNKRAQLLAGKYRLISAFAAGGMGELWLAEHVELETTVVVKRMRNWGHDARALERFRREAKVAANLRSRHVVRVFDFGLEDSGPYLVMERLQGHDLSHLIDEQGPLDAGMMQLVVSHTTKALRAAHAAGLVHRDIKPSNLFLTREEGEVLIKVLDFGIAKEITPPLGRSDLTGSGALVGSPGYMSPEQVRGQAVDPRSDLWSFGAVIYEMLTGRGPFASEHLGDSLARVCSGSYERLSEMTDSFAHEWDEFFNRAFSVSRDTRFQTVDDMADAFATLSINHNTSRLGTPPNKKHLTDETLDGDSVLPRTKEKVTPLSVQGTVTSERSSATKRNNASEDVDVGPTSSTRHVTEAATMLASTRISTPTPIAQPGAERAETLSATHRPATELESRSKKTRYLGMLAVIGVALAGIWVWSTLAQRTNPKDPSLLEPSLPERASSRETSRESTPRLKNTEANSVSVENSAGVKVSPKDTARHSSPPQPSLVRPGETPPSSIPSPNSTRPQTQIKVSPKRPESPAPKRTPNVRDDTSKSEANRDQTPTLAPAPKRDPFTGLIIKEQ